MPNIVIIDDEYDNLENLSLVLTSAGHKVFKFDDGFEALDQIEQIVPDIIICDIMMPQIDGYKIKETLAENSKTATIPFIFLSAKSTAAEIREGLIKGADDYLLKPFKTIELLQTIELRIKKVNQLKLQGSSDKLENRVCIKLGKEIQNIFCDEIIYVSADNQYSIVFTKHKSYKVAKSLNSIEKLLPFKNFIRIHRSTIVNLDYVEKYFTESSNRLSLKLSTSETLLSVSQRFSKNVREKLNIL